MDIGFYIMPGALILVYGFVAVDFIIGQRRIRRLRKEMKVLQDSFDSHVHNK